MKIFMVEILLPETFTPEFFKLIPRQQEAIAKQFKEGKITSYSLNEDRSKLWTTALANDEQGVMDLLAEWPMIHYMRPTIHGLFFHETAQVALPSISLN